MSLQEPSNYRSIFEACCDMCARRVRKAKPVVKERAEVPAQVKHCVAKVAAKHGGDTSTAFAICVAAGQKNGTLKKGSITSTKAGKKADRRKSRQDGHSTTMSDYEDLLATNRKTENISTTRSILTEMRELLNQVG